MTQAKNAKEATEKKEVIERAQVDVLGVQSDNEGKITKTQFISVLEKFFVDETLPSADELPDDMSTATQKITAKQEYGGYEIKIVEIWSGKFSTEIKGKKIADLYDEINNPDDDEYNEDAMHIGDWVNYTAGNWGEDKPTPTEDFTFGGYTKGQSRDKNANGEFTGGRETAKYEDWRIWDISDDKQTITLISAGCPEEYFIPITKKVYIAEYMLTGNINDNADKDDLGLGTTYMARKWDMYKNTEKYANSAKVLTKIDLDTWYRKYIDSSIEDTLNLSTFPANNENKLISTVENQCFYWIPPAYDHGSLYFMLPEDRSVKVTSAYAFGVRILVSLTSEVIFEETPEKIEKDGFTYNKWIIK